VSYEGCGDSNKIGRTSLTDTQGKLSTTRVLTREGDDALRVSKSETVDGLVRVAGNCQRSSSWDSDHEGLIRSVEVLVFIHNYVVECGQDG
jgi:hypothetical protein